MPRYSYGGDVTQTYPQYLDVGKNTTLVAEPGQTYDVAQVEGLTVPGADENGNAVIDKSGDHPVHEHTPVELPMPPDDRWTADKPTKTRPARAETSEEN